MKSAGSEHDESPAELAWRVARELYARDKAARYLGIIVGDMGPGTATLTMTVRPEMLNGHDICHGGMIFTLADTAFAYACNSRNEATVAAGCSIEYLFPARSGETLIANAREVARRGRQGVYDVTVTVEGGETVATFRGRSATLKHATVSDHEGQP